MTGPRPFPGLAAVADRYRGLLLDQWGVLHDGVRPYPGLIDALTRSRAAGLRAVIVSNSARRAAWSAARMARLGIGPGLYDALLTSGEAAWQALAMARPGRHCRAFVAGGDVSSLDGLGLTLVPSAEAADFLYVGGLDAPPERHADELRGAAARGLPLICANVDLVAIAGGRTQPGPGVLARLYAALGGPVTSYGKPDRVIYGAALEALGVAPEATLAVGDSLTHDIAGGAGAGCDTLLLTQGIHADDIARRGLAAALAEAPAAPTWVAPSLAWGAPRA